jgi:hypothetical protein
VKKLIFYAVDSSALHLYLARLSLQSLRRRNPVIPVKVFLFGMKDAAIRRKLEKLGAEVISLPKERKSSDRLPSTFLKWQALEHVDSERALFVDADTWFFDDPEGLFERFGRKDFCAREEYGTRPGAGFQLLGNYVLKPQIHPKKFKAISVMLDFKQKPIFNTGVMVFNHGFAARMGERLNEMRDLLRFFARKPAFYPAENPHIIDEVVSSIVFGRLDKFSYAKIPKEISPWYCEWKARAVTKPGIVMHSWSKYSPFFVREFAGPKAAAQLPFLIRVEKEYSEY